MGGTLQEAVLFLLGASWTCLSLPEKSGGHSGVGPKSGGPAERGGRAALPSQLDVKKPTLAFHLNFCAGRFVYLPCVSSSISQPHFYEMIMLLSPSRR